MSAYKCPCCDAIFSEYNLEEVPDDTVVGCKEDGCATFCRDRGGDCAFPEFGSEECVKYREKEQSELITAGDL